MTVTLTDANRAFLAATLSITESNLVKMSNSELLAAFYAAFPGGLQQGGGSGISQASFDLRTGINTGKIYFDDPSLAGASDKLTMTNVLSAAAAYTRVPWIVMPARVVDLTNGSYDMFTGLKIAGPGYAMGPLNEEISSGKAVPGKISTYCGSGTSSLFKASVSYSDVIFKGIEFHGFNTSQIFSSTGANGLYPAGFHDLTFYGCKSAFGDYSAGEKFLATQNVFSGHHTVIGAVNTQFYFGGSDCSMWVGGYLNIGGGAVVADGRPAIVFDTMSKTDIGYIYMTCTNGWSGIRVNGNSANVLKFFGGSYEGISPTTPSNRPPITITGGRNIFYSPWTGQVAHNGSALGVVEQTGGHLVMYSPTYRRSTVAGATEAFPFLYQTGGTARIMDPISCVDGERIYARLSTGRTVIYPNHLRNSAGGRNIRVTTSTETLTVDDEIVIGNGATITLTLPSAAAYFDRALIIKNVNATTLTVSGTIDGGANPTLTQYQRMQLISDGTSWYRID